MESYPIIEAALARYRLMKADDADLPNLERKLSRLIYKGMLCEERELILLQQASPAYNPLDDHSPKQ